MAIKSKLRIEQLKEQVTANFKFVGANNRRLIEFDVDEKIVLGDNTGGATTNIEIDGIPSGAYVGIADDNLLKAGANVVDDDFLRVAGTVIEGRSAAELRADISAEPASDRLTELATMALNTSQALADLSNTEVAVLDGATASNNAASKAVILDGNQDIVLNTKNIHGLAAPTAGTDAVNRDYVDARAAGLDPKESVYVATTANVAGTYNNGAGTITAAGNGALGNIDGEATSAGERILLKSQTDLKQNGIYTITNAGSGGAAYVLTRATDADADVELSQGVFVFVVAGTLNGGNGFLMSHNGNNEAATIGTDNLTFTQFTGSGSFTFNNGLAATGNQIDVDLAADSGLEFNSNQLRLKIADDSLERDGSNAGVSVKLKAAAGLVIQGSGVGLKVDLAGADVEGVTRFSGKSLKNTLIHSGGALAADTNKAAGNVGGGFQQSDFTSAATADREIFLNGQLLLEGANAGADNDWYTDTAGSVKFEFAIEDDDVITFVYRKV